MREIFTESFSKAPAGFWKDYEAAVGALLTVGIANVAYMAGSLAIDFATYSAELPPAYQAVFDSTPGLYPISAVALGATAAAVAICAALPFYSLISARKKLGKQSD